MQGTHVWENILQKSYLVNHTFTHNEKSYLIGVFCDEIYKCIAYVRLIISLNNKDSIMYKTLLSVIKKIEEGEKQYIVSKRVSKKIFISVGIRKYNQLKIRYKLPKNKSLSLILNCYNDTCNLLY